MTHRGPFQILPFCDSVIQIAQTFILVFSDLSSQVVDGWKADVNRCFSMFFKPSWFQSDRRFAENNLLTVFPDHFHAGATSKQSRVKARACMFVAIF